MEEPRKVSARDATVAAVDACELERHKLRYTRLHVAAKSVFIQVLQAGFHVALTV